MPSINMASLLPDRFMYRLKAGIYSNRQADSSSCQYYKNPALTQLLKAGFLLPFIHFIYPQIIFYEAPKQKMVILVNNHFSIVLL